MFVCLYKKNVKTAEPIGPKFFNSVKYFKILKIRDFFYEIHEFFFVLF